MDIGLIITAIVGTVTTFASSGITWIFARRKYNSEVDNNLIENMQKSLEFYLKLSDDNAARLDIILKRNEALELEVSELRKQVSNLMITICTDLTCLIRKRDYGFVENSMYDFSESNPSVLKSKTKIIKNGSGTKKNCKEA